MAINLKPRTEKLSVGNELHWFGEHSSPDISACRAIQYRGAQIMRTKAPEMQVVQLDEWENPENRSVWNVCKPQYSTGSGPSPVIDLLVGLNSLKQRSKFKGMASVADI